jgi:hypothetical protein
MTVPLNPISCNILNASYRQSSSKLLLGQGPAKNIALLQLNNEVNFPVIELNGSIIFISLAPSIMCH